MDGQVTQACLGTALFASGAISTWRAETIVDVLLRHDTMHKGDDVQQGLILHCLAHKPFFLQPQQTHPGDYKVRCTCTRPLPMRTATTSRPWGPERRQEDDTLDLPPGELQGTHAQGAGENGRLRVCMYACMYV
jgi:hypothetical protein